MIMLCAAIRGQASNRTDDLFTEGIDLLAELFYLSGIENRDHGSLLCEQHRSSLAAFSGTKNCDRLVGVRHIQRSLSVASPSKANMTERIQNRTITVFSFQPLSSKW